ncbi:hypothetical protein FRC03_000430 [Tulasnella sp. 419]|nr:hypothetical protein FRC03_000430 [Tulasnella sp. 419]
MFQRQSPELYKDRSLLPATTTEWNPQENPSVLARDYYYHIEQMQDTKTTTNPISGWYSRAVPINEPFTPNRASLAFASSVSARSGSSLTAAFFSPDIVVDARGVVMRMDSDDWNALNALARRAATEPPDSDSGRSHWRIKHEVTCRPIDYVYVATDSAGKNQLKQVSVYGFSYDHDVLKYPVGEYTTLHPVLKELFGLVREARSGYKWGSGDQEFLDKVQMVIV